MYELGALIWRTLSRDTLELRMYVKIYLPLYITLTYVTVNPKIEKSDRNDKRKRREELIGREIISSPLLSHLRKTRDQI